MLVNYKGSRAIVLNTYKAIYWLYSVNFFIDDTFKHVWIAKDQGYRSVTWANIHQTFLQKYILRDHNDIPYA